MVPGRRATEARSNDRREARDERHGERRSDRPELRERRKRMGIRYGGWAAGLAIGLLLVAGAVVFAVGGPGAITLGAAVLGLTGAILVLALVEFGIFYIVPKSLREERGVSLENDNRIERQTRAAVDDARLKMNTNMARFESEMDQRMEAVDADLRQRLSAQEALSSARFEELETRMQGDLEEMRGIVQSESRAASQRMEQGMEKSRKELDRVRQVVDEVRADGARLRDEIVRQGEEGLQRERILGQRLRVLEEAVAHESEAIEDLNARLPGQEEAGDVPVAEIEGIRADQVLKLRSLGIHTASQLRKANAQQLARELSTWPNQVRHWQALAELMRVEGVGPDQAEALDAAGVHDVRELGDADPDTLAERISALLDVDAPSVHHEVDRERIRSWVDQARRMEQRP